MKTFFLSILMVVTVSTNLFSQGTTRVVLYEEFSGENCAPCAAINPDVNDMVDDYPFDVILLKYQAPIPSAGPIYYQNTTDVNTRRTYYSVNSAPWGEQDGRNSDVANNIHPYYWVNDRSYLDDRLLVSSAFNLAVVHEISTDADSFYATVTISGADNYTVSSAGKLKLRVAMIEDLKFTSPPGTNGETEFHHVMRKMYPSAAGTTLADNWTTSSNQTLKFSGKFPAYIYDKTKVRFVAFIQDDNTTGAETKRVQQAAISDAVSLPLDAKPTQLTNTFLSCTGDFSPTVVLNNNGSATITSADLDIYVDNVLSVTHPWTGSLAWGASTNVIIPALAGISGGAHALKVIARNPNGFADLNNGNDTVKALFAIGTTPAIAPLTEGFETGGSAGWIVENTDGGATWTVANVGNGSSKSYRMDFFNSSSTQVDHLYTPRVDLTGYNNARIKFDRAHARYPYSSTSFSDDLLNIEVSTNCGDSWTVVYAKYGAALSTRDTTKVSYTPTAGDWKADSASLASVANKADVLIRFKGISDYGNNLYIDNINIFQYGAVVSGIGEAATQLTTVYPNPATDVLFADIALDKTSEVSLTVLNLMGQKLIGVELEMNAGLNPVSINTSQLAQGTYLLQLTINGNRAVKQFNIVR